MAGEELDPHVQIRNALNRLGIKDHSEVLALIQQLSAKRIEETLTGTSATNTGEKSISEIVDEILTIDNSDIVFGLSGGIGISTSNDSVKSFIIDQCRIEPGTSSYVFWCNTQDNVSKRYIQETTPNEKNNYRFCNDGRNIVDFPDLYTSDTTPHSRRRSYWQAELKEESPKQGYNGYFISFPDDRGDTRESVTTIFVWIKRDASNKIDYERVVNGPGMLDLVVRLLPGVFNAPSKTGYGNSGERLVQEIRENLNRRYQWGRKK